MPQTCSSHRKGNIVILAAAALVAMILLLALAVDLGYLYTIRTEVQCAADAGALAGAGVLPDSVGAAKRSAREYVERNVSLPLKKKDIRVEVGHWDYDSRQFQAGDYPRDAMQVTVYQPQAPLFFGRLVGRDSVAVAGQATAMYRPRDIMLVLDFSGSMNSHRRVNELKSAVSLFSAILEDVGAEDRVGFSRYSTFGELVLPLSHDFDELRREVRKTDANGWTNIGHGMELGRQELEENARPTAMKMMVIMTDGKVNRPKGRDPKTYVTDEAERARDAGITAVTISFGFDADKSLMQEVADITKGTHFNVPDSVSSREDGLRAVFRKIALNRPSLLVN